MKMQKFIVKRNIPLHNTSWHHYRSNTFVHALYIIVSYGFFIGRRFGYRFEINHDCHDLHVHLNNLNKIVLVFVCYIDFFVKQQSLTQSLIVNGNSSKISRFEYYHSENNIVTAVWLDNFIACFEYFIKFYGQPLHFNYEFYL